MDQELPIISKKEMKLLHEHVGLSLGIKKAAIFYVPFGDLDRYLDYFKGQGYSIQTSDFSYLLEGEHSNIQYGVQSPNSLISVYVSKNETISRRLKLLDSLQQSKTFAKEGLSGGEVFFEIADLLGYPKCCSSFLQQIESGHFSSNERKGAETLYSNETLYPMLALAKSEYVNPLLNNFSEAIPSLITFHVCRYDCPMAVSIAQKILAGTIANGYPIKEGLGMMSTPMIFFSTRKTIFLPGAKKQEERIHYDPSKLFFRQNDPHAKEKRSTLLSLYGLLKIGDSFQVDDSKIQVYSKRACIGSISKQHSFDGVFISFDE